MGDSQKSKPDAQEPDKPATKALDKSDGEQQRLKIEGEHHQQEERGETGAQVRPLQQVSYLTETTIVAVNSSTV